jgi:hypothetical protein
MEGTIMFGSALGFLADHGVLFGFILTSVSVGCSLITMATPTPPPGSRWRGVYRAIELAGFVAGYAKDHGLVTPSAATTRAAGEALELGHDVIATFKAKTLPPPQVISESRSLAVDIVQALRDAGIVTPVAPPPPPPAPGPLTAAIVACLLFAGSVGLVACAPDTAKPTVDAAAVASAYVLPPAELAKMRDVCAVATPLLETAEQAPDKTVSNTASSPAEYCRELNAGQVPPTTDANTPKWLPKAIAITQAVAKVAGVALPLILGVL